MENLSTKARILKSAQELFTVTGFTGTSTVDIAKNAQVSQGLMFHYFGSKENLWKEAQQDAFNANSSRITLNTDLPFKEFLETLFASILNYHLCHPDLFRLRTWDYLEKKTQTADLGVLPIKIEELRSAFQHYQNLGDIDPQLKMEYIETFLLSILHPFSLKNLAGEKQQEISTYIKFFSERLQKSLRNQERLN